MKIDKEPHVRVNFWEISLFSLLSNGPFAHFNSVLLLKKAQFDNALLFWGKLKKPLKNKPTASHSIMSWKTHDSVLLWLLRQDPSALMFPYCGPADTGGLWLNQAASLWPTLYWTHLPASRVCLQATLCSQNFYILNADAVWAPSKTSQTAAEQTGQNHIAVYAVSRGPNNYISQTFPLYF